MVVIPSASSSGRVVGQATRVCVGFQHADGVADRHGPSTLHRREHSAASQQLAAEPRPEFVHSAARGAVLEDAQNDVAPDADELVRLEGREIDPVGGHVLAHVADRNAERLDGLAVHEQHLVSRPVLPVSVVPVAVDSVAGDEAGALDEVQRLSAAGVDGERDYAALGRVCHRSEPSCDECGNGTPAGTGIQGRA